MSSSPHLCGSTEIRGLRSDGILFWTFSVRVWRIEGDG